MKYSTQNISQINKGSENMKNLRPRFKKKKKSVYLHLITINKKYEQNCLTDQTSSSFGFNFGIGTSSLSTYRL